VYFYVPVLRLCLCKYFTVHYIPINFLSKQPQGVKIHIIKFSFEIQALRLGVHLEMHILMLVDLLSCIVILIETYVCHGVKESDIYMI